MKKSIKGDGWVLDYKAVAGKVVGIRYHGKAGNLREAMNCLDNEMFLSRVRSW